MNKKLDKKTFRQKELEYFSSKIEEIKKPIGSALSRVFNYNIVNHNKIENYISAKFFNDKIKEVKQQDVDNAKLFMQSYINKFERIKEELNDEDDLNETQKKLLLNIINGYILKLRMFEDSGIYIEAEKGGYRIEQKDKIKYLKNIDQTENIIYGPKISDSNEEKGLIMFHLQYLFDKEKNRLDDNEKEKFKSFLKIFPERISIKENKDNEKNEKLGTLNQIDFCKVFQKVFEIYGIESQIIKIDNSVNKIKKENNILYLPGSFDQKTLENEYKKIGIENKMKIIIDPNVRSISMGKNKMTIPGTNKQLELKRVFELIEHEINVHFLTDKNNEKSINLKSENSIELQEGVAVMNAKLITSKLKDLNVNKPIVSNIAIFIGENYNLEDTKNLLKIYFKLNGWLYRLLNL